MTDSFRKVFGLVLLLAAGHFSIDFMLSIWPVYKTMMHVDIGKAAFIAVLAISVGELMQLVFGRYIDKGYQKSLLVMGPLLGASACLFPYCSGSFLFFLLLFGTTLGSAAFHPTAASLLSAIDTPRKALLMGFFQMSGNIGLGVGQFFFATTYTWLSGQTAVLMIPACVLACIALFSTFHQPEKKQDITLSYKVLANLFRIKQLRMLYFIQLCHQMVLWSTVFLLPDFLLSKGYNSFISFGAGHFVLLLGAGLGCLPAGLLGDRFTPAKTIFLSYVISMICFFSFLTIVALSETQLFLLLFCLGASLGPITPLALSVGTALLPDMRGIVSAFLMGLVWIVSEAFGIGISGFLADWFMTDGPAKALLSIGIVLPFGAYSAYQLIDCQDEEILFSSF